MVAVAGGVEGLDGWLVPLAEGGNAIAVEVTAENGSTTRTYTVTVRRAPAGTATCRDGTSLADPAGNPDLVRDCEILLALKDELDPTNEMLWRSRNGLRLDLNEWDGVFVRGGRVREIVWDGAGNALRLAGVLPEALGELDALEVLDLWRNDLRGGVPESLRRLARLEVLDLRDNPRLDAEPLPAWLGEMTSLRALRLNDPGPGPIPDEWSALLLLEDLEVFYRGNGMGATGTIPDWLGEVPRLRRLSLAEQNLTGTIPVSLAREFDYLNLRFNALTGCVPLQLADREGVSVARQGPPRQPEVLPACALVVHAGEGRDVQAGETVELAAAATGYLEGATLAWSWTQQANGAPTVTLAGADGAAPSFVAPRHGAADVELVFKVEVSDVEETSGSAAATVTYRLAAQSRTAPSVSGPTAYEVAEGETAVATLSATDADTAAELLEWRLAGGADAARFVVSTSGVLTLREAKDYEVPDDADGDGVYDLRVEVSDGVQADAADLTVALTNRNEPPTADAGADQSGVAGGSAVTLSGRGEDPDANDTLAYAWEQTGGTTVSLSAPSSASTTFTAPSGLSADADLTFRLRVTDGGGLTAEDEVTVTVPAADPDATRKGAVAIDAAAAVDRRLFLRNRSLHRANGDAVDYYTFTTESRYELGLGVRDQGIDLDVYLEDEDGEVVMQSWPPPVDASIEWLKTVIEPGTYYVRVVAMEDDETGYYVRFGLKSP